jgi:hypothetical protein
VIRKLRVFSDRSYLPEGVDHVVMLYPFWGKNPEDPRAPESGRFDRYTALGGSFFEMHSLAEADVTVMPAPWERVVYNRTARDLAERFGEKAEQAGKQTVVFFCSDADEEVPIDNSIIFRTSFYRSRRKPNEFALPGWSEDLLERYLGGGLPERPKRLKPVVGFCGHAEEPSFKWKLARAFRGAASFMGLRDSEGLPLKPGFAIRAAALRVLAKCPEIETNFLVRESFLGGVKLPDGRRDLARMRQVRLEFVQNMVDSDYILCTRGSGNFSYRLYETLCCGRIPVIVDTDCVLPYDFAIDWKKFSVWVEESEIPWIGEMVAEFHRNLSPGQFIDLQHQCRKLWEQWLSPEGFFAHFRLHFRRRQDEAHLGR